MNESPVSPAAPIVNAFTIDVEDYFQVEAFASVVARERWPQFEYRCERNVARLLELLAERNVLGTFLILGWIAEHSPQLVRDIARAGHEIACHGWSHKLIYKQTPEEFREETTRSKSLLEDLVDAKVRGYRAASFRSSRSIWALDCLIISASSTTRACFNSARQLWCSRRRTRAVHDRGAVGRRIVEFPMSWRVRSVPATGVGRRLLPHPAVLAGARRSRAHQRTRRSSLRVLPASLKSIRVSHASRTPASSRDCATTPASPGAKRACGVCSENFPSHPWNGCSVRCPSRAQPVTPLCLRRGSREPALAPRAVAPR
jgi:polysaccharide deacetylase family protein (PEP-CTERM system associated)